MLSYLIFIQGLYYVLTGLWPIISINTFQKITGPKNDTWLVKTVGAIITVIGLTLMISVLREEIAVSMLVLALGSTIAFMGVDVNYTTKKVISPIYLLDAAIQLILFILLLISIIPADINV